MIELWDNFFYLFSAAAPWLLLGLIVAGLLKAWIPTDIMSRHLGKPGVFSVIKGALIGAPLPLCSCGVIPAALGLRKAGASKSATVSFLVATPETGVDSIAVSYALLGPLLAIVRPVAAISSGITAGALTFLANQDANEEASHEITSAACEKKAESCCSKQQTEQNEPTFIAKTTGGLKYAFTKILDEIVFWLLIGIVFATVVKTLVDPATLATFGSGLPAMIVIVVVGIPMYVCATASTPIAAGLLLSGISPGTVLVFLLAGPATNMATLGMVKQSMGTRTLVTYLGGVFISSIGCGVLLDYLVTSHDISVVAQIHHHQEVLPVLLTQISVLLLALLMVRSLLGKCIQKEGSGRTA